MKIENIKNEFKFFNISINQNIWKETYQENTDRYKLSKTFSIFYKKINLYIDTLFLLQLSIHGIIQ